MFKGKLTIADFIDKSQQTHRNKYNYSKVILEGSRNKICITCPIHGDFFQRPSHHLSGRGCPQCGKRHTNEKFQHSSRLVHGDKYEYSKVQYITNKIDVIITCKIHGDFSQNPWNHLKGHGCSKCNMIGRYTETFFENNKDITGMLYVVKFWNSTEEFYKLGITTKTLLKRFEKNKEYNIRLIKSYNGKLYDLFKIEQELLKAFVYRNRYIPIDFIGGDKECFKPCPHLLHTILQELDSQIQTIGNS